MSPKSLLRHPKCVPDMSAFEENKKNRFEEYYDDPKVTTAAKAKKVKRVLFCSGKVYYDLLDKKESDKRADVATVRIEQLYPFPKKGFEKMLSKYKSAEKYWVQEEPENMGAWRYILARYPTAGFEVICRKASASPASGFKKVSDEQQAAIIGGGG